jgi:hypothetical protein
MTLSEDAMNRPRLVGATAAAMLPAALSAAVLVSAPFAGTTTTPLADTHPTGSPGASRPPAAQSPRHDGGLNFSITAGDVAVLVGFELCLVGVGAGVIVTAARRRSDAAA